MFRRFAIVALACSGLQCAFAIAQPGFAGGRHAAMVIDANTGQVLHAEDADELRHPASLTKMMTLYLTFETIETGRLSMSDKIRISQEAASQAPSKLELDPGEEITVSDAVRALITKSANDVAVALAEKVGGSEKNFVRLMNTRARELGMLKTHFENASGLPNNDQVTTARDMITLGLRLQDDFPNYYPLFATRAFTFNRSTYRNHNTMLNSFQGVDGIKTGYTQKSGFNLVSSVRRGGRHVVGAVFGGASAATRNGEMRMLMTRALTRASTIKTRKPAPSLIAKLKSAPKLAERPKAKEQPKLQVAEAPVALPQPKPFAPAAKSAAVAPAPVTAKAPAMKPTAPPPAIAVVAAKADPAPMAEVRDVPIIAAAEPSATDAPVTVAEAQPAPIDVFKVKRVMVAPRQGPIPPPPSADQTTDMAPDETPEEQAANSVSEPPSGDPLLSLVSATAPAPADKLAETLATGNAPGDAAETVIPKTNPNTFVVAEAAPLVAAVAARRPSPLDDRIAMLGAADVTPDQPATAQTVPAAKPVAAVPTPKAAASRTAALTPTAKPAGPVELGRAPSSLQAQAERIPAVPPQRMASLQPPAAPAETHTQTNSQSSGRFEIQIGAYGSIDEAERALVNAQGKAGKLLAGYASVTHPVQKAGRQIFRARFSGFDSARASSTCTELRRQAIDCFVMTAE